MKHCNKDRCTNLGELFFRTILMLLIQLSTWGCVWVTQFWEVQKLLCSTCEQVYVRCIWSSDSGCCSIWILNITGLLLAYLILYLLQNEKSQTHFFSRNTEMLTSLSPFLTAPYIMLLIDASSVFQTVNIITTFSLLPVCILFWQLLSLFEGRLVCIRSAVPIYGIAAHVHLLGAVERIKKRL